MFLLLCPPCPERLPKRVRQALEKLQRQPAKMVVRAAYQDDRAARWLSDQAHIPVAVLPFTVGGSDKATDLFGFFEDTVQRLLEAAR